MDYFTIFAPTNDKTAIMKEGFTGERSIVLPPMAIDAERNDPLVGSLYITDIGYYPHADSHYCERKDPITQYVLLYCMEGAGWYRVAGQQYNVRADQYIILPPGIPHTYAADASHPWTIYWIHFTGEHAAFYCEGALTPRDITPAVNSRISERQHIFEDIFSTLLRGYDLESLRYASSLLHYYLASMRYLHHYRQQSTDNISVSQADGVVTATIHYMHENLERRLTLDQLARYTGYSASRFSSIFRQQTGQSPLAFLNQLKIQRACQLLQTTGMRINQICHKVGFDDSYYFSRLFKQQTGHSPRQYREMKHSSSISPNGTPPAGERSPASGLHSYP